MEASTQLQQLGGGRETITDFVTKMVQEKCACEEMEIYTNMASERWMGREKELVKDGINLKRHTHTNRERDIQMIGSE